MPKVMKDEASHGFSQVAQESSSLLILNAVGELFNHYDGGWPLWSGNGDRILKVPFKFDLEFKEAPLVLVTLSGIDADSNTNLRYEIKAENISPLGFEAVFVTWNDSKFARGSISWTAIGEKKLPLIEVYK